MKVKYILPILAAAFLVLPALPVSAAQASPILPRLTSAQFAIKANKTAKKPVKKKTTTKKAASKTAKKKAAAKPKKKSTKKKSTTVKKKPASTTPAPADPSTITPGNSDTTSADLIDPSQPATAISATFSTPLSTVDAATQPVQPGISTTKRFAIAGIAGSTALSLFAILKRLFLR